MRVLTVDDDENALDILNLSLREAGYEVVSARNGRQALDILRANPCRVVITDWEMPEMDGLDLCRAIRAEQFYEYIYVILLTVHDSPEDTVRGLSAGADDYLGKPFHPGELKVRVQAGERVLAIETRDLTIFAMAKLAESRDPETGAHLERVRNYCRALVEAPAEDRTAPRVGDSGYGKMIYLTSPLHDIGKLGVPDSVLLKPGRLDDREFEVMKCHTTVGAEALDAALAKFPDVRFLQMARDVVATHHERFDGSGYPLGLKGEDIPLCGRIVALADVYDALTSRRVYKNAFQPDVSKAIIVQESGSHFDPRIVEAFLKIEQQFLEIQQRFTDDVAAAA